MAVIKNGQSGGLIREPAALDLGDLRQQGRAIVEGARREAERLIAAAHEEVRGIVETASERGHAAGWMRGVEEGRIEGRQQARAEALEEFRAAFAALERSWKSALEQWQDARRRLLAYAREDVLELALAVARKVIHRNIEHDPSLVVDQIAAALSLVMQASRLSIAVNPADRKIVELALPEILHAAKQSCDVVIVDGDEVERGGCVINTGRGSVDANISVQIERIVEMLLPPRANLSTVSPAGVSA